MKHSEIEVGKVYRATVSGKKTNVRIDCDRGFTEMCGRQKHRGWDATNVTTGRRVLIATAARLSPPLIIRCRTCANCKELDAKRKAWTDEYRAALNAPNAHDLRAALWQEWRETSLGLPCSLT